MLSRMRQKALGRRIIDRIQRRSLLWMAAPALLVGATALPAFAITYYFIFDIHANATNGQTLFSGVAVMNTTATTLNGEYYFNEILGYQTQVLGQTGSTYTPTAIGIGTTTNQSFGGNPVSTYNSLNNQTGANTPVANPLGSIQCSNNNCYLRDAAFGWTVNGGTKYYWFEGIAQSSGDNSFDLHEGAAPVGTYPFTPAPPAVTNEGYLSNPNQVLNNAVSDCGATLSSINSTTPCAILTSNPLPEINSGRLPKVILLLGALLLLKKRATAKERTLA